MKAPFLATLLCGSAQAVELQSGYVLADDVAPPPAPAAVVKSTVWYHGTTDAAAGGGDNIVGATAAITAFAAKEKAGRFGFGAPFLKEAGAGDVPLKSFFSESLQDTLTTASTEGLAWASAHGYKFMQIEGYCSTEADPGGAEELVQYWSAGRNDSYIVAKGSSDENSAKSAK
jgi:hypothetical protein